MQCIFHDLKQEQKKENESTSELVRACEILYGDRRWKDDNRKTLSRDLAANENEDKGCFSKILIRDKI
jgi:hypothetical protein